jgi:hypothetical protein
MLAPIEDTFPGTLIAQEIQSLRIVCSQFRGTTPNIGALRHILSISSGITVLLSGREHRSVMTLHIRSDVYNYADFGPSRQVVTLFFRQSPCVSEGRV